MEKVNISLENCYGIRSLEHVFDFSEKKSYVVYAPNGVMKTSFAKTMDDLSQGKDSEDRIYKHRETTRKITDENGEDITPEQVFVVEPYNEGYKSKRISTLLVNKALKRKYDDLHDEIDEKKEALLKEVKKYSGLKKDVEEILSEAITHDKKKFFLSLSRLKDEVQEGKASQLGEIHYPTIFNAKVLVLLEDDDFRSKLNDYINIYDQLTASSTFFKKGVFNHNNADDIAKNLNANGYFKADHTVNILVAGEKQEISNTSDLQAAIQLEKNAILENEDLAISFEAIDSKLKKNIDLKKFRDYIEQHKFILPELDNLNRFRQNLWVAYLTKSLDSFTNLMEIYENGKKEIESIVSKAKEEKTKWLDVIGIFNKRFSVPFVVSMENQDEVILNSDAPNIKFKFQDNESEDQIPVEEKDLLEVLSNGEKRALYILNIIFEVEARKEANQETLFIVDDIADSFDYKNKYAIAEYLKDISLGHNFFQIILSHNFDFYRTISSRLDLGREQKLHTVKTGTSIKFIQEKYQNNPFNHWKNHLDSNDIMLVAAIPFIRNLAEYCGFDEHFQKLTSLLHQKQDTNDITIFDLEAIIRDVLKDKNTISLPNGTNKVKELIYNLSSEIASETDEQIDLEKKIVLSIAIRLKAENYLISKINDQPFVDEITKNQTFKLIQKYKNNHPTQKEQIKTIERVNLMTPENIHLNSFMYEPILDMSSDHLKALLADTDALSDSNQASS